MVGLGVGIDYALLLVTRHVEFLTAGHDRRIAAGRAAATAGRSVVFASATVLVSLLGLRLAGLPVYSSFGFATAIAVLAVMAAAITLVPALCGLAGDRLLPRKVRKARKAGKAGRTGEAPGHDDPRRPLTARWAATRRPPAAAGRPGRAALPAHPGRAHPGRCGPGRRTAAATAPTPRSAGPTTSSRTSSAPAPTARSRSSSTGRSSPTATSPGSTDRIADQPGIAGVGTPQTTPDGAIDVIEVEPTTGPADPRTSDLVHDPPPRRPPRRRGAHRHDAVLRRHLRDARRAAVARGRVRGLRLRAPAGDGVPLGGRARSRRPR